MLLISPIPSSALPSPHLPSSSFLLSSSLLFSCFFFFLSFFFCFFQTQLPSPEPGSGGAARAAEHVGTRAGVGAGGGGRVLRAGQLCECLGVSDTSGTGVGVRGKLSARLQREGCLFVANLGLGQRYWERVNRDKRVYGIRLCIGTILRSGWIRKEDLRHYGTLSLRRSKSQRVA
ncbi:uncharacterized protein K452DRAFT_19249 [Aplosporella prunicola CBS 121167]|uniref:Uncharacterized protein n=1 Tax=Aplosporella prunicola CBS 121167 TaxID=1176127 RepID=A0A6A6BGD5_9PEZI|nr:uncharacterized protein K452DRAFT_19249 [Aplosporella prunicola CBS 121167]KAF2142463.1 hypothetical protein K452DRAFT_19249 [Aplosporella prunicola CBS 121167]